MINLGMKLNKFPIKNLLSIYGNVVVELRNRGVLRTFNNPVADYAEYIIAKKLKLKLTKNSNKEYDAIDLKSGIKYQIKSRRITRYGNSRQLGVIRNLNKAEFNFLIAVIFNESFDIVESYKIPRNIIKKYARFSQHQNGHILILRGDILKDKNIKLINF